MTLQSTDHLVIELDLEVNWEALARAHSFHVLAEKFVAEIQLLVAHFIQIIT